MIHIWITIIITTTTIILSTSNIMIKPIWCNNSAYNIIIVTVQHQRFVTAWFTPKYSITFQQSNKSKIMSIFTDIRFTSKNYSKDIEKTLTVIEAQVIWCIFLCAVYRDYYECLCVYVVQPYWRNPMIFTFFQFIRWESPFDNICLSWIGKKRKKEVAFDARSCILYVVV